MGMIEGEMKMGYMKIPNLYSDQTIMMFKKVWVTEKVHGTSAWILYYGDSKRMNFHPGGAKQMNFEALFDEEALHFKLTEIFGEKKVRIYGEHFGGKLMKMSGTYGKTNQFIVFEIQVDDCFLSFEKIPPLCEKLDLMCVPGEIIDCTLEKLDEVRDRPSLVSKMLGIEGDKAREGIVIRPLIELTQNNGKRTIAKHKNDAFRETTSKRKPGVSPEVLLEAEAIADEWCTHMRFMHVLDAFLPSPSIKQTGEVIRAMREDIVVEADGEFEMTSTIEKAISKKTSYFFRGYLQKLLEANQND